MRLCLALLVVAVGGFELENVRPVSYKDLVKPRGGKGVVDMQGVLSREEVQKTLEKTGGEAYVVIVGKMGVEEGWREEEDESDVGDRIVRYSTSLAHRWKCVGDCVLFIISIADRQLKLRCNGLNDYQTDEIISSIKEDLRERAYTSACSKVISQTDAILRGLPPSWTVTSFASIVLLYSLSAMVMFPKYALPWLVLFILYLLTTHWSIPLVTAAAACAVGFRKYGHPLLAPSPPPDPWAV